MATGFRLLCQEHANPLQDLMSLDREISDIAGIQVANRKGFYGAVQCCVIQRTFMIRYLG